MRIFVDMDGTLAKWNNVEFEQLFEQGYFRNLEPNATLVSEVRELINSGHDVYVLSAYLIESDYAEQEKREWLAEQIPELLPEKTILLPYGENKAAYLKEHYSPIAHDDVLIDDYTQNLLEWKAYGGEGIKFLNGINHTRGTWKGLTTDGQVFHLRDTVQAFGNDAEKMQGLLSSGDMSFRYQLLDRLRSDCDYYLGNGGAQDKFLWAGNIHSHIYFMRGLWNSLPEGEKPEWLSLSDIDNYERQMLGARSDRTFDAFLSSAIKEAAKHDMEESGAVMSPETREKMRNSIVSGQNEGRHSVRERLEGKSSPGIGAKDNSAARREPSNFQVNDTTINK